MMHSPQQFRALASPLHWRIATLVFLTAVFLTVLTTACSQSRQSQCLQLVTIANQAVGEVQATIQANANPNNSAYVKVAEAVDRAKTAMGALKLEDAQLQGFQQRFMRMYTELGTTSRALAAAVEKQDPQAAETAQSAFETATRQEEPLVNEVNAYCNPQQQ